MRLATPLCHINIFDVFRVLFIAFGHLILGLVLCFEGTVSLYLSDLT